MPLSPPFTPSSFNALASEEPLTGPLFLEASAGTGKTFAIEHCALRLMCENKIPLEKILIVTFTRAAARELRERIRHNIESALNQLSEGAITTPYLKNLNEEDHLFLEEALLSCDNAPIYTIHSFCHRALMEFAFEAKAPLSMGDPDEREGLPRLVEEILNFFRSDLSVDLISTRQLKLLLRSCRRSLPQLALKILDRTQKERAARPYTELKKTFDQARAKECDLLSEFIAFAPLFKELCDRQKTPKEKWIEQVRALQEGSFETLLQRDHLLSKLIPENLTAKAAYDIPPHWVEMVETISPLIDEALSLPRLIALIQEEASARIEKMKKALDLYTPDDLIDTMKEALEQPPFVSSLRTKYRAVVIDEFQDTDATQWHIFKTLFLTPSTEAFLLVGDPKQSIYSFRGADLNVYFEAGKSLGFAAQRSLDTNYRSDPALVDALNTLFSSAGDWLIEGSFHPVKAGQKERVAGSGVDILLIEGERHPMANWPTKEIEESALFPFILSEIIEKGYALKDVAILIKDRFQAARLEQFLTAHNIPVLSKGVKPLKESDAFTWMRDLFYALDHLGDPSHLKRFLGHALMPYTLEKLCLKHDHLLAAMAHLYRLAQKLDREGPAPFLKELLECDWDESGTLFYQQLDLQDYGDLIRLCELLIEEGNPKTTLKKIQESHIEMAPQYKRMGLAESDAITIMTMHMSKGLEFPIVFALGCASRYRGTDSERSPAEEMRGLYVALTRAKYKLYFPVVLEREKTPSNPSPAELFFSHLATPLTKENIESALAPLAEQHAIRVRNIEPPIEVKTYERGDGSKRELATFERQIVSEPVSSFTALAQGEHFFETPQIASDDLTPGAETGVKLHALFETIIGQALFDKPGLKKIITELFPQHTALVEEMVQRAFTSELVAGLRLCDIPPGDMAVELELLYKFPSCPMIKGFIDLVFKWQGRYYILDWKSNYLGMNRSDYESEALGKVMARHDYFFQGALYTEALRLYLAPMISTSFDKMFGGVIYLFLRGLRHGVGSFHFKPDLSRLHKEIHERAD